MPLKSSDNHACLLIEYASDVDAVAVERRASTGVPRPQRHGRRGRAPACRRLAPARQNDRRRLRELPPRKLLAGVDLSARRDIGMRQNALRQDAVAGGDAPAKIDDGARSAGRESCGNRGEGPGLTISMPTECELMSVTPRQKLFPACQARSLSRTICTTRPSS